MTTHEKMEEIEKHLENIGKSENLTANERFLLDYITLLKKQILSSSGLSGILSIMNKG